MRIILEAFPPILDMVRHIYSSDLIRAGIQSQFQRHIKIQGIQSISTLTSQSKGHKMKPPCTLQQKRSKISSKPRNWRKI